MSVFRLEDVSPSRLDDLVWVCSRGRSTPSHLRGVELKKAWVLEMLDRWGPVAKIAYAGGQPVGQVLYYPASMDPDTRHLGHTVLYIRCIYCPFPEHQRMGIGRALLEAVIGEAVERGFKAVVASGFNTGEYLPLPEFYRRMGFKHSGVENYYVLTLRGEPPRPQPRAPRPLPGDEGRALVFYSPKCQFSLEFAESVKRLIESVLPSYPVVLINYWEEPGEFLSRGRPAVMVNGVEIRAWAWDREQFIKEVLRAAGGGQ